VVKAPAFGTAVGIAFEELLEAVFLSMAHATSDGILENNGKMALLSLAFAFTVTSLIVATEWFVHHRADMRTKQRHVEQEAARKRHKKGKALKREDLLDTMRSDKKQRMDRHDRLADAIENLDDIMKIRRGTIELRVVDQWRRRQLTEQRITELRGDRERADSQGRLRHDAFLDREEEMPSRTRTSGQAARVKISDPRLLPRLSTRAASPPQDPPTVPTMGGYPNVTRPLPPSPLSPRANGRQTPKFSLVNI